MFCLRGGEARAELRDSRVEMPKTIVQSFKVSGGKFKGRAGQVCFILIRPGMCCKWGWWK